MEGKGREENNRNIWNETEHNAPINVIPGGGGREGVGGDFDKAFMPEGVAFDFIDSPQGADI